MTSIWKTVILEALAVATLALPPHALGKGTNVQFLGTVTRVNQISAGQGSVTVQVMGFDLSVKINTNTEIALAGDIVGLKGISPGDFVKVSGFFTTAGIVAQDLEILDDTLGEFRLRGSISTLGTVAAGRTITVLGSVILLDPSTIIEKRGSTGNMSASDLAAGMHVDTRGIIRNGQLVARSVKAGSRAEDPARIEFDGLIVSNQGGRLLLDTLGGGLAAALVTASTQTKGSLAAGQMITVKGTFNPQLEVVAESIAPQGDEEGTDDRKNDGPEVRREAALLPTVQGITFSGKAEIMFVQSGTATQQQFSVRIERAVPNNSYRVLVNLSSGEQLDFGFVETDREGNASVMWRSTPKDGERDIKSLLPQGRDVRDFARVMVAHGGGTLIFLSGKI
jgi:Domain of unknown function (DUF5666)